MQESYSPLLWASKLGNILIVKYLLSKVSSGVDMNLRGGVVCLKIAI